MTLTLELNNINYLQEQQNIIYDELLKAYEKQLDVKENTKRTYLNCLKQFMAWLEKNNINSVEYETILSYKSYLKSHEEYNEESLEVMQVEHKARAINTHLTAIKDFFKYLECKGFKNVAKGVKKERTSNNFTKDSLTLEQVKGIYESIDINTIEGARANALFRLLIGTGLRECEVIRADIQDIGVKADKNVLYVQGKGETEKNNYVIITPSVMNALQHYFKMRGNPKPSEPLFTSNSDRNNGQRLTTRTIQRIVKGLYANNGIISNKITTHSTRHTAITLSVLNGASIQQAQSMARHKDINTTMIYFHNINRLEDNAESKLEQLLND